MQGQGKRESLEKIRRSVALYGTVLRCENPGSTMQGNRNRHDDAVDRTAYRLVNSNAIRDVIGQSLYRKSSTDTTARDEVEVSDAERFEAMGVVEAGFGKDKTG
ncbi:hypothetical protein PR048_003456 [Dryococelus australis]|uniref:Uncharacterized protein n=1 Tax=Dryococelus australis TaxID=614101 RepID=A0ABQ9IN40_9NEOP|nr:hypothetical protein PR048_003456 [Dryococelus australis]